MIRLRTLLERGCAHPVLGLAVLVVVVLLLAMVFLHVAHEDLAAASELGAICVGIASALGFLVAHRLSVWRPRSPGATRCDRGPPAHWPASSGMRISAAAALPSFPLRR